MDVWMIVSSGLAYVALIFLVLVCVFAVSITDNRLQELRYNERALQRNAEKIANLGGIIKTSNAATTNPEIAREFSDLIAESRNITQQVWSLSYQMFYGKKEAWEKKERLADWFHAMSDATNVMIIGMAACTIALCAMTLLSATHIRDKHPPNLADVFGSVTIFHVCLGMLTGLVATFIIKSGSSVLSKTSFRDIDASNPYGIAFFAVIVGFFMDKLIPWLEPFFSIAK